MTTETSFQTASMAKFITAMAMLKAVQNGDFRLDENVNYRLNSWRVRILSALAVLHSKIF